MPRQSTRASAETKKRQCCNSLESGLPDYPETPEMPPRSRGGGKRPGGRSKRRSQPLYAEDCAEETGIRRGELHLALQRPDDYVRACQELAALLRLAYAICTKHLQRYLEEQCLAAVECCSSKQRDRRALDALCREAKRRFPKQQAAQLEKAYKQLCVVQQRELKRHESQNDEDEEAPVQTVPAEVLARALALLPPQDIAAAMCVDRSWSQAASSPALWESFVRRTFGQCGYAGVIAKASRDENRDEQWHAVFSRIARKDGSGAGPVERWRHNRVVVRGRLAWTDAFDPAAFHRAIFPGAVDKSQATIMFPTPAEAARIMLGEAAAHVQKGSSSSSSSSDDSSDDGEGEEGREGGAARGGTSGGAGGGPSAAASDGAVGTRSSRRRQRRLWAVPESMRNLSLG